MTASMTSSGDLALKCSTPGCCKHSSNQGALTLSGQTAESYWVKLQRSPGWRWITESTEAGDSAPSSELTTDLEAPVAKTLNRKRGRPKKTVDVELPSDDSGSQSSSE